MKATGIVRRVDDLGRIVIPKEIRRTLKIREGEPLRIHIDAEVAGGRLPPLRWIDERCVGEVISLPLPFTSTQKKRGEIHLAVVYSY